jgi:hypothetical protein
VYSVECTVLSVLYWMLRVDMCRKFLPLTACYNHYPSPLPAVPCCCSAQQHGLRAGHPLLAGHSTALLLLPGQNAWSDGLLREAQNLCRGHQRVRPGPLLQRVPAPLAAVRRLMPGEALSTSAHSLACPGLHCLPSDWDLGSTVSTWQLVNIASRPPPATCQRSSTPSRLVHCA